ncbi:hypothetical protein [Ferroacidibacillus organovorans]|uniref:hypothetical protein n=1 Tax=Ferroacidibacillus organovorans TaxID=1765683 RepID=UPI0015C4ADAB|nr:hypothetical protein [Ferroacidibacillus organovorans]
MLQNLGVAINTLIEAAMIRLHAGDGRTGSMHESSNWRGDAAGTLAITFGLFVFLI